MSLATVPSLSEIESASATLRPHVLETPLVPYRDGELGAPGRLLLKPEILQAIGSFKIRGVLNAVSSLSAEDRARGLLTVSAGNTAQALAWAGRHFGVAAYSVMPEGAPATKIAAVRALGGTPRLVPTPEVFRFLREEAWHNEPHAFIHPWTDRAVMVGHGSLGLEIVEGCPQVDSVFVSVGGGGLISGTAAAIKARRPEVRIVAVEPRGCPALHRAFASGAPVEVECQTICDGIAVPYITDEMFPLLRELVDEVTLVAENEIKSAIRTLALANKMVVEPSGAITVAAALAEPEEKRGLAVCVLSGGSLATELLIDILQDEKLGGGA